MSTPAPSSAAVAQTRRGFVIFGLIIIFACLLAMVVVGKRDAHRRALGERGVHITARVIGYHQEHMRYTHDDIFTVRFRDVSGVQHTTDVTAAIGEIFDKDQSTVDIVYDPDEPTFARTEEAANDLPVVAIVTIAIMLALGVVFVIFAQRIAVASRKLEAHDNSR